MHRLWSRFIHPVITEVAPRRIMEIGADFGWNTGNILIWCRGNGCHAHIIDPAPRPVLHEVMAGYENECTYHALKSIDAIAQIEPPDVVLLDGDHNWATVFSELNLLFDHAADVGAAPPVVMSHDVAWPYARRDMYYNPDDLDGSQRHPYAYRGILPGVAALTDEGMNGKLANALHEGGPRNGVLTAIEDFIASREMDIDLYTLPFFNGLGIVVPEPRRTKSLNALIQDFYTSESLLETCCALEEDSMRTRARLVQTEARLTERTDALRRARTIISGQRARIGDLEDGSATPDQEGERCLGQ